MDRVFISTSTCHFLVLLHYSFSSTIVFLHHSSMKFHFLTLLILGCLFLCPSIYATEGDDDLVVEKRAIALTADEGFLVKRCEGRHDGLLDLDCLTGSVVDLLQSILGDDHGHGHDHHYDDHETDLVRQLVKLIRKLLHTLGLNHHGGLDLDDLLGGLLGHDNDHDDDFGCGCDGDSDALVDHLIETIEDLLHELVDCKDGLIPRLVTVVTDLLGGCKEEHHRRGRMHKRELKKRCGHHGDGLLGLDCLLDSVVDLLQSILGGHDHHHYDHSSTDLVTQLVKLLRKLLHSLGLSHHGDLDLDGLLGGLLGHGHEHDNDDDFGCGCGGDDNALVDHLVELIQDLLKQLAGCKDGKSGLIPRLIEAVTDLLEDLLRDRHHGDGGEHHGGEEHHGDKEHHGGEEHHGSGDHDGHCGDSLGLDCLLDTVVGLVDSLLGGGDHGHDHGHVDVKVSHLLDELVRVVRRLLGALDMDGGLKLDVLLGGGHHNDDDDFGCGCDGDNDSLVAHLIETIDRLLGQLGDCDDDSGLIAQLIKTVRQLLTSVHHERGEHELRKRFALRKRSTFGKRHGDDALDVGLLCGVLDTIQDLLNQILGECNKGGDHDELDADLLEKIRDLIRKILKGVKEILDCLTGGKLGGLNHSVSSLVKQVCALLECLNGREHRGDGGLDDLLDALVENITSLVNGCRLARLIDLDGLVVLHH